MFRTGPAHHRAGHRGGRRPDRLGRRWNHGELLGRGAELGRAGRALHTARDRRHSPQRGRAGSGHPPHERGGGGLGRDVSGEEARSWDELVERCTPLATDVTLPSVAAWKAANPQRKVVGCFPVYTPQELIAAAGALPVSLFGGRGQVEIDHADSRIQSFVCSIARSTLELGLAGQWKHVDGMVVPSICDVARNLLGVWQRNFPDRFTFYLHLPQNVSAVGVAYYRGELERLRQRLAELTGALASDKQLHDAIRLFNRNRALLGELYQRRALRPEQWPTAELYVFAGAGYALPREEHNRPREENLAR